MKNNKKLLEYLPIQQGLKLCSFLLFSKSEVSFRISSNTTRIETQPINYFNIELVNF